MFCHCTQDKSLSEYVLVYVDNRDEYVNHDFIREYGVIVDFAEREHPLLHNHKSTKGARIIHAFTVAEAIRLVEWEAGNLNRKPLHRILDIDKEELTGCSRNDATNADLHQAVLERYFATNV